MKEKKQQPKTTYTSEFTEDIQNIISDVFNYSDMLNIDFESLDQ
ncbi:hypothetical protein [Tenacibaculum sp. M341]|nr:hypothetical protein [Tenacibaculum sp. M341]